MNINLYEDIVPIVSGSFPTKIEKKIEDNSDNSMTKEVTKGQDGSGFDKIIEKSFQHPRPIKTETIVLKTNKRQKEAKSEEEGPPRKERKNVKHKFQFA